MCIRDRSCPSFNELTRDGQDAERHNLLHPTGTQKVPFVTQQLDPYVGPVVASTDYMKAYAEQIRPFIPKGRTYKVLGTDGSVSYTHLTLPTNREV